MTTPWASWKRRTDIGGATITNVDETAVVIVRERVRPVVSIESLCDVEIGSLRANGFTEVRHGALLEMSTNEGERAAVVTITARRGSEDVEHSVGVILGDDFVTRVEARSLVAKSHTPTRELVLVILRELPIGLGHLRYRRFSYRAPAGWERTEDALVDRWSSGDASIVVLPARPLHQPMRTAALDNLLRDDVFDSFVVDRPLSSSTIDTHGMTGVVAGVIGSMPGGPTRAIVTAALRDVRFLYVMRLQTSIEKARADEVVFLEMVRSCKRVPVPLSSRPTADLSLWGL